jgi:hypothetical protein
MHEMVWTNNNNDYIWTNGHKLLYGTACIVNSRSSTLLLEFIKTSEQLNTRIKNNFQI